MEAFLAQNVIQAHSLSPCTWDFVCSYWHWAFWVGSFVGVVGAVVCFMLRPTDQV